VEHGRTGKGYGSADTGALEGTLADFFGVHFSVTATLQPKKI
jgi:hypothetical protein